MGEISMPYFNECQNTIDAASSYYEKVSRNKASKIEFEVINFNQTSLANFGVDGLLSIKGYGNLNLKEGVSVDYYVRGIADSIAIECMPMDRVSFYVSVVEQQINRLNRAYGNSRKLTVFEGNEISIYHNKNRELIDYWRE